MNVLNVPIILPDSRAHGRSASGSSQKIHGLAGKKRAHSGRWLCLVVILYIIIEQILFSLLALTAAHMDARRVAAPRSPTIFAR
jgi:hypothetical protein